MWIRVLKEMFCVALTHFTYLLWYCTEQRCLCCWEYSSPVLDSAGGSSSCCLETSHSEIWPDYRKLKEKTIIAHRYKGTKRKTQLAYIVRRLCVFSPRRGAITHNFSWGNRCGCISARSPPGSTSKAALLSSETPRRRWKCRGNVESSSSCSKRSASTSPRCGTPDSTPSANPMWHSLRVI